MGHHSSDVAHTRAELLVIPIVMTTLGSMTVVAHMISRQSLVRNVGIDDWIMVVAWLGSIALFVETVLVWKHGMGKMSIRLLPADMIFILKDTVAIEVTYYSTVFVIKLSILYLYLRFATQTWFRAACSYTIYLLTTYTIMCIIVLLVQCRPLHKSWDITRTVKGTCINRTIFFYITAGFNIATDIWVTILPIRTLVHIQRPKHEKAALVVIFAIGAFSCIAAMIRLQSMGLFTNSKDPFFDAVPGGIWSVVEIQIAIICCSLPSLKPLLCYCSSTERSRRSGNSGSGSRGYIRTDENGIPISNSGGGGRGRASEGKAGASVLVSGSFPMTPRMKSGGGVPRAASSDTESTKNILEAGDRKGYPMPRIEYVHDGRVERARNMV